METKLFTLILSAAALFVLTGCAATKSTITEYDASGNILKKTETSESVISSVTKSTQNKSVIIWEDGWAGSTIRPRTAESLPARSTRELSAFCRTRADFPESPRSFRRRRVICPSAWTAQRRRVRKLPQGKHCHPLILIKKSEAVHHLHFERFFIMNPEVFLDASGFFIVQNSCKEQ